MRFRLVSGWGPLYQLYVDEVHVPVGIPSLRRQDKNKERMVWTWLDGVEYALLRPSPPHGEMTVFCGERVVCCGRAHIGMNLWAEAMRQGRATMWEWDFAGQTFVVEGGNLTCCNALPATYAVRPPGGIRLAFYCLQRGQGCKSVYRGVARDNIPQGLLPIVFAIILVQLHAPSLFQ
jgi:hypothetical protein